MEKHTVVLEIQGKKREYPYGTQYWEIVNDYQKEQKDRILLVMAGNRLRELHRRAKEDCRLEFITMRDPAGYNAYRRSLCLMMLKAIHQVLGNGEEYQVGIHFVVSDGLYCTLQSERTLDQAFLDQVKEVMRELCEAAIPIEKRTMDTNDAVELFHRHKMYDKEKRFRFRRSAMDNVYSMGKFGDSN